MAACLRSFKVTIITVKQTDEGIYLRDDVAVLLNAHRLSESNIGVVQTLHVVHLPQFLQSWESPLSAHCDLHPNRVYIFGSCYRSNEVGFLPKIYHYPETVIFSNSMTFFECYFNQIELVNGDI